MLKIRCPNCGEAFTAEISEAYSLRETEAYLNGLLHLASSCSEWVGRSEISAECFTLPDAGKKFAEVFGFSPETIELLAEPLSLQQALAQWIGEKDEKLNGSLCWLIRHKLGKEEQILRLRDEDALIPKLGWGEDGAGPYYFMEDLFFARFEKALVCFYMGNNE